VASILAGKESASYAPFIDVGDHVIVINAEKIRVTGVKSEQKMYRHYNTAFPAVCVKSRSASCLTAGRTRCPGSDSGHAAQEQLGRAMGKKLKVYKRRQA